MSSSTRSHTGPRNRRAGPGSLLLLLAVLVGAVLPVVGPADPAAAACSTTPRTTTETINVGGVNRTYRLRVPAGLTGPSMLVLSLHPGLVSVASWDAASGWNPVATTNRFVVAYPQGGLFNTWDPNNPAGTDYPFLMAAVDDIKAKVCIDDDRVHVSGYSMGGWMSQRLACQSADVFASVGAGGAGHPEEDDWWPIQDPPWPCSPNRPIAVHLSMGTDDDTVAGLNARDEWRADDTCGPNPTTVPVPLGSEETWSCAAGTEVVWRTYAGYAHVAAATPYSQQGVAEEYAFFLEHPRP